MFRPCFAPVTGPENNPPPPHPSPRAEKLFSALPRGLGRGARLPPRRSAAPHPVRGCGAVCVSPQELDVPHGCDGHVRHAWSGAAACRCGGRAARRPRRRDPGGAARSRNSSSPRSATTTRTCSCACRCQAVPPPASSVVSTTVRGPPPSWTSATRSVQRAPPSNTGGPSSTTGRSAALTSGPAVRCAGPSRTRRWRRQDDEQERRRGHDRHVLQRLQTSGEQQRHGGRAGEDAPQDQAPRRWPFAAARREHRQDVGVRVGAGDEEQHHEDDRQGRGDRRERELVEGQEERGVRVLGCGAAIRPLASGPGASRSRRRR